MNQRTLFDPVPPAQRHSATSQAAAEEIAPRAGTLRAAVLATLQHAIDGLTDEQMQDMLGMGASTQRPRRVELVQAGLVRDSGRTRLTRSGRKATVWVAA
jgi:hypothetical protein